MSVVCVCTSVHKCTHSGVHMQKSENIRNRPLSLTISFLWNNASHWTWNLPVFQLSRVIAILLPLFPITGVTGYHVAISSFLQRCWGPRCRPHACIAGIFTYGPSPFLNTGLSGVHYHTQLQDVFIFDLLGQFLGIALHAFSKSSCLSQFATHLHWSRHFKFVCLFICLGSLCSSGWFWNGYRAKDNLEPPPPEQLHACTTAPNLCGAEVESRALCMLSRYS